DDESLELFRELLSSGGSRPVFGIFTARPEPRVGRFSGEIVAELLSLGELDLAGVTQFVGHRLARWLGDDPPAAGRMNLARLHELARHIYDSAGGNPFFVGEMIDSLIERGALGRAGTLADSDALSGPDSVPGVAVAAVPSSIESLLATRIDHLPEREKETLLTAAVLGRSFRGDALGALLDRPVTEDLDAMTDRGLLSHDDERYSFHNDLSATVAYQLLPLDERARLHLRAAAISAQGPSYRAGATDAVVARHLEQAGDRLAAARRYTAAGVHAADLGGNGEALRLLTRALELLPEDDHARRFDIHSERQELMRRLARKDDQLRETERMRAEAESLADPDKLALAELPSDTTTLSYDDFALRSFPYAGDSIDQDIVCQLLHPGDN
ncbi:MAG: hypothetical protein AAGC55_32355, partial [Myxococcota bacterium]